MLIHTTGTSQTFPIMPTAQQNHSKFLKSLKPKSTFHHCPSASGICALPFCLAHNQPRALGLSVIKISKFWRFNYSRSRSLFPGNNQNKVTFLTSIPPCHTVQVQDGLMIQQAQHIVHRSSSRAIIYFRVPTTWVNKFLRQDTFNSAEHFVPGCGRDRGTMRQPRWWWWWWLVVHLWVQLIGHISFLSHYFTLITDSGKEQQKSRWADERRLLQKR